MPRSGIKKVAGKPRSGAQIYIGTSGWHYTHWNGIFYPPEIKGYNELRFFSEHFNTVENNSSFYRIAGESTYKTWSRMTPDTFKFSLKFNKSITHTHRLKAIPEVKETVRSILKSLQVLEQKLGAVVIQLPASFKYDLTRLDEFLAFITAEAKKLKYQPDFAIEFRNKAWFVKEVYTVLKKHNVALAAAQSSRYPGARELTADVAYIRLHGPEQLFASPYSTQELTEWAEYIKKTAKKAKRIYVYFNNDIGGHALTNARELSDLVGNTKPLA